MKPKTTEEIMELVFDYGQARIGEYLARGGDQMAPLIAERNRLWKEIETSINEAISAREL